MTAAPAADRLSVTIVRGIDGLKARVDDWRALAADAIEPNCFYEPWMMIPAVESLAGQAELYFVLVYATDPLRPLGAKILCGFLPLEHCGRYKKLPLSTLRLWKHSYCFLCTPLLRAGYAAEALDAFFDWLESPASPAKLMQLTSINCDGAFHKLLLERFNGRASLSFIEETYNRALFRPSAKPGISGRHQKELRRQQTRLREEGRLEYAALEDEEEVEEWVTDFLRLEAGGWKGRQGSAFASDEASWRFFEAAVRGAFAERRLMMMALRLDGKPIAMKCNFLAGGGSFAFKIAFDESFSKYSPGVLLELENMRRLGADTAVEWMDSCAVSEHFMINRLWTERRTISTVVVSTGKRPADFLVSALPMLRWVKRKLSRKADQK